MMPDAERLIREEQARSEGAFVSGGVDFEAYLAKLSARAEILSVSGEGRCRGLVAFYANDTSGGSAFITLVVVDPRDRGRRLAEGLVRGALALAAAAGFRRCGLEVRKDNAAARAVYGRCGFRLAEDRGDRELLEVPL